MEREGEREGERGREGEAVKSMTKFQYRQYLHVKVDERYWYDHYEEEWRGVDNSCSRCQYTNNHSREPKEPPTQYVI